MKKFLILFALVGVVVGDDEVLPQPGECGTLNSKYFYNQTHTTALDEFPWMGIILRTKPDSLPYYTCMAVLISKQHMLTNAQCVWNTSARVDPDVVVLGEWDAANNITEPDCDKSGRCAPLPIVYQIKKIVIHPMYRRRTRVNDIALIQLAKPVDYSDYIRPICLPTKEVSQMDFIGRNLQSSGWSRPAITMRKKNKSFSQVMSSKECEELYKDIVVAEVFQTYICAYTCPVHYPYEYMYIAGAALMDVTAVHGKPGHYHLVGLESFGRYCSTGTPTFLIRVDRYLEWIKETIYFDSLIR